LPKGNTYGNLDRPSGFQHISRFGPSESALAQYLYPLAWRDVTFVFDDFIGGNNQEPGVSDWNEAIWVAAGTNGTAFAPPSTQLRGGVIEATINNVAGDEQTLRGDTVWLGDANCGMEIRYKVDDKDTQQAEMGFTDPLSGYAASVIDNIDTPTITNGATDVALVGRDVSRTLKTQAFITDGSTSNMNTTKTDLGTRTPTNATYQTVRVQLTQTASAVAASSAYILDENGAIQESAQHGSVIGSQIKGDVLLLPWFYYEPQTTSAIVVHIDYWGIWQDRA
jgi:hypothetical protein